MRVLIACVIAHFCGLGHWLIQWQHDVSKWAGLESDLDIRAGGTCSDEDEEG